MDLCKDELSPLAVKQLKHFPAGRRLRPVLVTTEKNNAVSSTNVKPGAREIMSRYKSSSPVASQTSVMSRNSVPQRAQSAERRRPSSPSLRSSAPSSPKSRTSPPSTPSSRTVKPSSPSGRTSTPFSRSTTPVRDSVAERVTPSRRSVGARAPDGLWPSMRNLSTSFQSDSPFPDSKGVKPVSCKGDRPVVSKSDKLVRSPSPDRILKSTQNAAPERNITPLRGRNAADQSENSRPEEHTHARAMDQLRWPGMIGGKASSKASSRKSMDLTDKISKSAFLSIAARGFSHSRGMSLTDATIGGLKSLTNRAERPDSTKGSEKAALVISSARNGTSVPSERALPDIRPTRNPSPVPVLIRPSSPSKVSATFFSSSRGMLTPVRTIQSTPSSPLKTRPSTPSSPSKTRPSSPCSSSSSSSTRSSVAASIFNYFADVQRGKRSPTYTDEAHQLRLLYNRNMQWRFVSARAEASYSAQTVASKDMLYNVWNTTSELRESVIKKRIDVEYLRQEMKLKLILEEQIAYLENWSVLELEHSSALTGAIVALKASTLRLPVRGNARADARALKGAISSAVDVMQAMGSSICRLLSRVEGTNSLVSELSGIATTESIMLDELREALASIAAMQVQECSLRTHLLQLRQDVQVK